MNKNNQRTDLTSTVRSVLFDMVNENSLLPDELSTFVLHEATDEQLLSTFLRVPSGKYSCELLEATLSLILDQHAIQEISIYSGAANLKGKIEQSMEKSPKAWKAGKWLGIVGGAAALAALIYKTVLQKYIKECQKGQYKGTTGLKNCVANAKIKAYNSTIANLKAGKGKCKNHINPFACRKDYSLAMRKIKDKISFVQKNILG